VERDVVPVLEDLLDDIRMTLCRDRGNAERPGKIVLAQHREDARHAHAWPVASERGGHRTRVVRGIHREQQGLGVDVEIERDRTLDVVGPRHSAFEGRDICHVYLFLLASVVVDLFR
jgi:hypothetical protein